VTTVIHFIIVVNFESAGPTTCYNLRMTVLILFLLILTNGLFAMSELAIVTARPSRLQQMAATGTPGAQAALDLAAAPNRFLSTVQIGITLIGILAGAFGGAALAQELAPAFEGIPVLAAYSESIAFVLVVGTITFVSVVLGEIVPKRIALTDPERIAALVAPSMTLLSRLATPLVRLLSLTTELILRLLGIADESAESVSEEEIRLLVRQSAQAGVIETMESEIVERVFKFGDRDLQALMTPRPAIVGIDLAATDEKNRAIVQGAPHTRFLVYENDLDNVVGVVRSKDLLSSWLDSDEFAIRSALQEPLFLPGNMNALQALERFKEGGTDMGLILDEFGGLDGLVTLIDILEALVGDIPTAAEMAQPLITRREDGSFLLDGLLAIDEFQEAFDLGDLPGEDQYQSLGGFILFLLGDIPREGQTISWGGWCFEVLDMDGPRIDKVLMTKGESE
jgi:putative hemolysin